MTTSTSLSTYELVRHTDSIGVYFTVERNGVTLRDEIGADRIFKSRESARKAVTRERRKDVRNKV